MFKLWKYSNGITRFISIIAIICVAAQGIFEGLQATWLGLVVNDVGAEVTDFNRFWLNCCLMLVFAIVSLGFGILGSWLGTKGSLMQAESIRHQMFNKTTNLSFGDIDRVTTSSILTRITNDVQKYQMAMQLVLSMFIKAPITFVYGIAMSFIASTLFGALFLIIMLLIAVGFIIIARVVIPAFDQVQKEIDNVNVVVRENVLGMKVVKSFCLEENQAKRFAISNEKLRKNNTKAWVGFATAIPFINSVVYIAMALVFIVAGRLYIDGASGQQQVIKSVGEIYSIIQLLMVTLSSVIIACMVIIFSIRAVPSAKRINDLLDVQASIQNCKNPKKLDPKKLDIEFKKVNFKYFEDAKLPVLKNINLKIKQGEMLGIVGPTGSGKTSLINLISRLYDFKETPGSSLTIGGIPIKEIDLNSLKENIGVVLQERILFSGTIKSNLLFGDQKAKDKDLMYAAKLACADEIINKKEGKLNGVVEQRGRNFSGGQQQRLCITRTLVKKPNILILDDSTSALDMLTEAKLQANIRKSMKQMTTIVVAQRISSVKDCDHIVVMEKGEIVGYGTHDSLRKSNKLYRSIVVSQMGKEGLTR